MSRREVSTSAFSSAPADSTTEAYATTTDENSRSRKFHPPPLNGPSKYENYNKPLSVYNETSLPVSVVDYIPPGYLASSRKIVAFVGQVLAIFAILVFSPWAIRIYDTALSVDNVFTDVLITSEMTNALLMFQICTQLSGTSPAPADCTSILNDLALPDALSTVIAQNENKSPTTSSSAKSTTTCICSSMVAPTLSSPIQTTIIASSSLKSGSATTLSTALSTSFGLNQSSNATSDTSTPPPAFLIARATASPSTSLNSTLSNSTTPVTDTSGLTLGQEIGILVGTIFSALGIALTFNIVLSYNSPAQNSQWGRKQSLKDQILEGLGNLLGFGPTVEGAIDAGDQKLVQSLLEKEILLSDLPEMAVDDIISENGFEAQDRGTVIPNGYLGTAVQAASFTGHEDFLKQLLDKGLAKANAQGGHYGTALQAAAVAGKFNIVQMLLNWQADHDSEGFFGTPLQGAAYIGRMDIVQLLLESGAEVNSQGGYYGTALSAAAFSGHEDIVNILLINGARINLGNHRYPNARTAAMAGRNLPAVNQTLTPGPGGFFISGLQLALYENNTVNILEELQNNDVDVNLHGGHYWNALIAAAYAGNEWAVQVLLGMQADVNDRGGYFGSALSAAAYAGHESVVKILLDNGAEINQWAGDFGSALSAAAYAGHKSIVETLIERGARVNGQGGFFGSALSAAAHGGHESIMQLLIGGEAKVGNFTFRGSPEGRLMLISQEAI